MRRRAARRSRRATRSSRDPAAEASDESPSPLAISPGKTGRSTIDDGRRDCRAIALDDNAGLADRLWAARETAEAVKAGDGRTRAALYRRCRSPMISPSPRSASPDEYAELLEESGVKAQARAPMTPIVKLVFGIDYDKARLTEFAAALSYAQRQEIALGGFQDFIEKQPGGLKALVAAERQARRPEPKADTQGRSGPRQAALGAADLARRTCRRTRNSRWSSPAAAPTARTSRSRSSTTRRWSNAPSAAPPERDRRPRGCPSRGARVYRPRRSPTARGAQSFHDGPYAPGPAAGRVDSQGADRKRAARRNPGPDAARPSARPPNSSPRSPRSASRGELALAIESTGGEAGNRRMRIGIVNDDMPFLVDSVANAIAARQLTIHRLLHPVVCVDRDDERRAAARSSRCAATRAGANR